MLLKLREIRKTYRGPKGPVEVLRGADLDLGPGEFAAVQGPSGAGKSTLLWIAGALMAPDDGEVLVGGEDPYEMSGEQRARFRAAQIGFVFQQFHLLPYLNVLDNILAPAGALPDAKNDLREHAHELIHRFGLEHRIHHVPSELSTGERQRTALARALLNRPKLLLADEPTGNLDTQNAEAVLKHLAEFAAGGGTVLLVTHDPRAAERARRVIQMEEGRLAGAAVAPA